MVSKLISFKGTFAVCPFWVYYELCALPEFNTKRTYYETKSGVRIYPDKYMPEDRMHVFKDGKLTCTIELTRNKSGPIKSGYLDC